MGYKAVIFDFNGVLVFDSHIHDQVWKEFSEKCFNRELTETELEQFHGRTCRASIEYLIGHPTPVEELKEWVNKREVLYRERCLYLIQSDEFKLSPGSIELFNRLKKKDIPFTIATSSDNTNLNFYVQILQLDKWFNIENIVYDDGKFEGKPAPHFYLKAAEKLGVSPGNCIVVEDSFSGLQSAKNAGIGYIIGLGSKRKHNKLREMGAHIAIITLESFPKKLY